MKEGNISYNGTLYVPYIPVFVFHGYTGTLYVAYMNALPGNVSPVKRTEKPHVIALKFQPGLKYELGHAHLFRCAQKSM